jgi:hypothetical protein
MPLFKNKSQEPEGQGSASPPEGGQNQGDQQYMTVDQFNEQMQPIQQTLGTVNKALEALTSNQQAYQQPQAAAAQPAEDPHKSQKERISQIDKQLEDLAQKADEAAYQGKGMADIMTQQNRLYQERSEIQGQMLSGQRDPRIDAGFQTLDALSSEVMSGKMPHLSVPEVKARYDHYVGQLAPEQRMNPEAKMGAYNLAVGENLAVITEANKQEWLRQTEEGGTSGRQHPEGGSDGQYTPERFFSEEALRTIKRSKHRNVETYVRSLGYESWDEYVEKNKDFLEEEEG